MNRHSFKRFITIIVADGNHPESSKEIQRELIINFLYQEYNSNPVKTVAELKKYLRNEFNLTLSTDEVEDCLEGIDQVDKNVEKEEISYQISPEHYARIDSQKKKNIDHFIDEYMNSLSEIPECDIKDSIYKFLYHVANNNLFDFQKIVPDEFHIQPEDEISRKLSSIQIEHINKFLRWENSEKNEIIYKLSNIGLEYFILSNTNGFDLLKELGVEQKHFYLDTNIIYRALGLNAQYRKDSIETFFNKCKETKQKLFITPFTKKEFLDSITYHCERLRTYNNNNPHLFSKFMNYSVNADFYHYYSSWKRSHQSSPISMFVAAIRSEYGKFIKRYEITEESNTPVNENTEEGQKQIDEMALQIGRYKTRENFYTDDTLYSPKYRYDAKNILHIDMERETEGDQYKTAKTFMVSADQYLLNWDHSRETLTPVVLLPSQWLSLMLRFVSRTHNDFESFVSFINIPNKKENITDEQMENILSGVNETTEDPQTQELIAAALIEQSFYGILTSDNNDTHNQILKRSKKVIDEKLGQLLRENEQQKIENQKELSKKDIELQEKNKIISAQQEERNISGEIIKLKKDRRIGFTSLGEFIGFLCLIVLMFFFQQQNWNFVWLLFKYIDSQSSETYKILLQASVTLILGLFQISVVKKINENLIQKTKEIRKLKKKLSLLKERNRYLL